MRLSTLSALALAQTCVIRQSVLAHILAELAGPHNDLLCLQAHKGPCSCHPALLKQSHLCKVGQVVCVGEPMRDVPA